MIVRRVAFAEYVEAASSDLTRLALGRRGADLSSGEDNDMILTFLGNGWQVAYRPELCLDHLIPSLRVSVEYLQRYARSSNRTWVQVLAVHGIVPWRPISRWTKLLRVARLWLSSRPWTSPEASIYWHGQLGKLEGRISINSIVGNLDQK
jgi:hypothetical protein